MKRSKINANYSISEKLFMDIIGKTFNATYIKKSKSQNGKYKKISVAGELDKDQRIVIDAIYQKRIQTVIMFSENSVIIKNLNEKINTHLKEKWLPDHDEKNVEEVSKTGEVLNIPDFDENADYHNIKWKIEKKTKSGNFQSTTEKGKEADLDEVYKFLEVSFDVKREEIELTTEIVDYDRFVKLLKGE